MIVDPVPTRYVIRRATADDVAAIAAVHVAAWRETYAGIIPQALLDALSIEDRAARWKSAIAHACAANGFDVFVAALGHQIVGFGSNGMQRDGKLTDLGFTGEINAVYVLRSAQGEGIGRALMSAMASELFANAHDGLALWVLESNLQARRFYERLGGKVVGHRQDRRDEATLSEVACGWRREDASLLAPPLTLTLSP